ATNWVQRSVTPEAFSAGTTAKVSSGYLPFQSCAEAEAVKASAAAPARTIRRVIMVKPSCCGYASWPIAGLQPATLYGNDSGRDRAEFRHRAAGRGRRR